jgi:hypothetical protein
VLDWLALFEPALWDHDLGPNKIVMLLAMQLSGPAKGWYQELKSREPGNPAFQSVDGWLAAIKGRYTEPNIELEAMATLKELKQSSGHNGLRTYINTFNRCVTVLGADWGDPRLRYDFVRGLVPKYREKCVMMDSLRGTMSLQELQRMLEQYEVTMAEATAYYPSYQRNAGGQSNRNDPMELGATSLSPEDNGARRGGDKGRKGPRTLPVGLDQATYDERLRKGLCFKCGESGHRSFDCPRAREQENEKGAQN